MLLKWILNGLIALVLFRLVRGLFRPAPARRVRAERRPPLDPKHEVPAEWSEVREDDDEAPR